MSLPDSLFGVAGNPVVVQQAVIAQQANARRSIAHTKTRGEVKGGGRKPWRQKGTGRARHGSIRSPIWKGGGVTFGPRNTRNFHVKVNAKARRKALAMVLSEKVRNKHFIVVDQLALDQPKTKRFVSVLKALPTSKTTLTVLAEANLSVLKATRNLPHVETIRANSLNVLDVLRYETLVATKPAVEMMIKTYGAKNAAKK